MPGRPIGRVGTPAAARVGVYNGDAEALTCYGFISRPSFHVTKDPCVRGVCGYLYYNIDDVCVACE